MKIGFIGAGKMAEAMIGSLVSAKRVKSRSIVAADVSEERRRLLADRYKITTCDRNADVLKKAQIVFLCIKPQQLDSLLDEIAAEVTPEHMIVSIVAGKRIKGIRAKLKRAKIARVMPNLPAVVGQGMSGLSVARGVTADDRRLIADLLSCFGRVLEVPESRLDAVTGVSGSGPAYFAYLANGLIEGGIQEGLTRKAARLLALQTMLGTAQLLLDDDMDPRDLVKRVATRGGTTEAGINAMKKAKVDLAMRKTVKAATQRSKELSGD